MKNDGTVVPSLTVSIARMRENGDRELSQPVLLRNEGAEVITSGLIAPDAEDQRTGAFDKEEEKEPAEVKSGREFLQKRVSTKEKVDL